MREQELPVHTQNIQINLFVLLYKGEQVFVSMDACHMLKLAHNMLKAYSPLLSSAGTVSCNFISHLNEMQQTEGPHAANKVTAKHINFITQKMKVSLAAH